MYLYALVTNKRTLVALGCRRRVRGPAASTSPVVVVRLKRGQRKKRENVCVCACAHAPRRSRSRNSWSRSIVAGRAGDIFRPWHWSRTRADKRAARYWPGSAVRERRSVTGKGESSSPLRDQDCDCDHDAPTRPAAERHWRTYSRSAPPPRDRDASAISAAAREDRPHACADRSNESKTDCVAAYCVATPSPWRREGAQRKRLRLFLSPGARRASFRRFKVAEDASVFRLRNWDSLPKPLLFAFRNIFHLILHKQTTHF